MTPTKVVSDNLLILWVLNNQHSIRETKIDTKLI